ncbi:hypothetical protein GGER_04640 [Serratia rubidaea]
MSDNRFDYIIVGAGSAGCVLAAQLIRRTQARVLLLEAGGDDNNLFIKMPAGVAKIIAKKAGPMKPSRNRTPTAAACRSPRGKCWAAAVRSTA